MYGHRNEVFLQFGSLSGWVGEGLGFGHWGGSYLLFLRRSWGERLSGIDSEKAEFGGWRHTGYPASLSCVRCCPAVFLLSVIFSCLFCSHPLILAPPPPLSLSTDGKPVLNMGSRVSVLLLPLISLMPWSQLTLATSRSGDSSYRLIHP